jgi:hypothetical protein
MAATRAQLFKRLKSLPAARLAEVADFVEFLSQREERGTQRLQRTIGLAAGTGALRLELRSADEFEAQVRASAQCI